MITLIFRANVRKGLVLEHCIFLKQQLSMHVKAMRELFNPQLESFNGTRFQALRATSLKLRFQLAIWQQSANYLPNLYCLLWLSSRFDYCKPKITLHGWEDIDTYHFCSLYLVRKPVQSTYEFCLRQKTLKLKLIVNLFLWIIINQYSPCVFCKFMELRIFLYRLNAHAKGALWS